MPLDRESAALLESSLREQADVVIRFGVYSIVNELKFVSPVDTGRFRASWTVSRDGSVIPPVPEGNYPIDPGVRFVGVSTRDLRVGVPLQISNNTEYAEFLNEATDLPDHEEGWIDSIGEDGIADMENQLTDLVQSALNDYLG